MSNIFTVPIQNITFEDIKSFCSEYYEENEVLDYKSRYYSESAKKSDAGIIETIAAMANTDGGIIIIGVQEKKEYGKSLPDKIIGTDEINAEKSILDKCYSLLSPPVVPEIKTIETDDPKKVIVIVRVDRDKVISFPVFHRGHGIKIRVGESNRLAEVTHIRSLLERDSGIKQNISNPWGYSNNNYNSDGYCWCTLNICLPAKQYPEVSPWEDRKIHSLKGLIEHHRFFGPIIQQYSDEPFDSIPKDKRLEVQISRGLHFTKFKSAIRHDFNNTRGLFFDFLFDTYGRISMTIGFKHGKDLYIENIIAAFYNCLELISNNTIKECYSTFLFDAKEIEVSYTIDKLPNYLKNKLLSAKTPYNSLKDSTLNGGNASIKYSIFNCNEATKALIRNVLCEVGFWDFDKSLHELSIDSCIEFTKELFLSRQITEEY